MKHIQQEGFTLIELIMVIVILGILAATALPKFVNMGGSARKADLQALLGALNSGVAIAQSTYLVNPTSTTSITTSDGTVVTTSTTGIPTADANGIVKLVPASSDYVVTYATSPATVTWTLNSSATCTVVYTGSTGVSQLTYSGC